MNFIKVIIGGIITFFGLYGWFLMTYGSSQTFGDSVLENTQQFLNLDNITNIVIYSILLGIGGAMLVWGTRPKR